MVLFGGALFQAASQGGELVPHFCWAKVTDNADPGGLSQVRVVREGEGESVTR